MPDSPGTATQHATCTAFAQVQDGEVTWCRPTNPSGFQGTATIRNLGPQPIGLVIDGCNSVYLKCEAGDFNVPENATITAIGVTLTLNIADGDVYNTAGVALSLPSGEGTVFYNPIPTEGHACHTAAPAAWGVEFTGETANGEWGVYVNACSDTVQGNTITLGGASLSVTYSTLEE